MSKKVGSMRDLYGLVRNIIWFLFASGILLAALQSTNVASVEDVVSLAKSRATHYAECIPAGECGLIAIIKGIETPGPSNPTPGEGDNQGGGSTQPGEDSQPGGGNYVPQLPVKTDEGIDYSNVLIDRKIRGYRGPLKGEPYVNQAGLINKDSASLTLEKISKVDESKDVEYSRSEWKHWTGLKERPCWNTREEVLYRDAYPGSLVYIDKQMNVTEDHKKACAIGRPVVINDKVRIDTKNSGEWIDPYSGKKMTSSNEVDIDHVIPLSYAAKNGGQAWDETRKEKFANDLDNLLATSAKENRAKGDKGPSDYMPPYKAYHCQYAKTFTTVAYKYDLTITNADYKVLKGALESCQY